MSESRRMRQRLHGRRLVLNTSEKQPSRASRNGRGTLGH